MNFESSKINPFVNVPQIYGEISRMWPAHLIELKENLDRKEKTLKGRIPFNFGTTSIMLFCFQLTPRHLGCKP